MKKLLIALVAVVLLAVPALAKDVELAWDASESAGVVGYKLYFHTDPDLTQRLNGYPIDVGNVLQYTVTGLPDGVGHYITATAYDAANFESAFSNIAYSPGFTKPSPPSGLGGVTTVNNIRIPIK